MFADAQLKRLGDKIEDLTKQVAALKGEEKARSEVVNLTDQIARLQKEVTDLEISKAKKQEEFARREREITHKVGLEKTRQEQELTLAEREAKIAVREENLTADRERFEEQMKFTHERFTGEVGYLKELMEQVLLRLPTVEVRANGNGRTTARASK